MSDAAAKLNPAPSRLQMLKAKGAAAMPALPQKGTKLVDITLLMADPSNERKTFNNVPELAASMKTVGLLDPILVELREDGRFDIVAGERRFRAAKLAGFKKVEVKITDAESESKRRLKSLISNIQRENVPGLELAIGLQTRLDDDPDIKTQRDLAAAIGKGEEWVSGMLRTLKLPVALQHKLGCTQVSYSYDSLIRIARVDDEALQTTLVDDLLGGADQKQIRESIKEAKKPGKKKKPLRGSQYSVKRPQVTVTVKWNKSSYSKAERLEVIEEVLAEIRSNENVKNA